VMVAASDGLAVPGAENFSISALYLARTPATQGGGEPSYAPPPRRLHAVSTW
jgi:hypothetical protein